MLLYIKPKKLCAIHKLLIAAEEHGGGGLMMWARFVYESTVKSEIICPGAWTKLGPDATGQ